MPFDTIEREDTPVICVARPGRAEDIPSTAQRAWQDLEALVPIQGRKAFGYWYPPAMEYRACFSLRDGDEPAALGLQHTVLPGGRYRRARLKGDDVFERIGETFDALAEGAEIDESRPWLELYRRHDEVDVLIPVLGDG